MKYLLILILIVGAGAFIFKQETDNKAHQAEVESTQAQLEEAQKVIAESKPSPNGTTKNRSGVPAPRPAAAWLWDPSHKTVLDKKK